MQALVANAVYLRRPAGDPVRMGSLRRAVQAGSRLWAPVERQFRGRVGWWDWEGTRPYVIAIHELGRASEEIGDFATAMHCYESLVRMNPEMPLLQQEDLERVRGYGVTKVAACG